MLTKFFNNFSVETNLEENSKGNGYVGWEERALYVSFHALASLDQL